MPTLPAFDLELLGERLAELESQQHELKPEPLCDFLGLIFFDVKIFPDSSLEFLYRCPKGEQRFGAFPKNVKEALALVHPDDQKLLNRTGESFVLVRMKHEKTDKFNWYFIKSYFTKERWFGVMFQGNRVEGFGPGLELSGVMETERFTPPPPPSWS